MAQHDQVLGDAAGAAFRADANNALAALFSNNSGATEPAVTVPYMLWADTTTGKLKMRNELDTGWIEVGSLGDDYASVASAATAQIFASPARDINYTGTATATAFDTAPQAGAKKTLHIASYGAKFTLDANLTMDGFASGYTYTCYAGMIVDVIAITTTSWKLSVRPYSAVWTNPTLYNVTNVAASTTGSGSFSIVGNRCTADLYVQQDPTTAGIATELGIAIGEGAASPPASNFTGQQEANGVSVSHNTNGVGQIYSDTTNDRPAMITYPPSAANTGWRMNFGYIMK